MVISKTNSRINKIKIYNQYVTIKFKTGNQLKIKNINNLKYI